MFYIILLLIFKFDFVVKVNGNSTTDVDIVSIIQEGPTLRVMDNNIPLTSTTPRQAHLKDPNDVREMKIQPELTTPTTTKANDHEEVPDFSYEVEPPFVPLNPLVTLTLPDQMKLLITDIKIFNNSVEEHIIAMYGKSRPDKYTYVANCLWNYIRSSLGQEMIMTLRTTTEIFTIPIMTTLTPLQDYYMPEKTKRTLKLGDPSTTPQETPPLNNQQLSPYNPEFYKMLPVRVGLSTLSTFKPDQETQLTQNDHNNVYLRQGINITTLTPAYPDHTKMTVESYERKMIANKEGYFTTFARELCIIIAKKEPSQSKKLYIALQEVLNRMIRQSQLIGIEHLQAAVEVATLTLRILKVYSHFVQKQAPLSVWFVGTKDEIPQDIQVILHEIDGLYNLEEGGGLFNALVEVDEYPKNNSASVVAEKVVENLSYPYFRDEGSQKIKQLIQLIKTALQKYSSIDSSEKIGANDTLNIRVKAEGSDFGNTGYYNIGTKDFGLGKFYTKATNEVTNNNTFNKSNRKFIQNRFSKNLNKLKNNNDRSDENNNDKDRNKAIKELIENVKVMEAIKKYKSIIVRTTSKPRPSFDKIHDKLSDFGQRANSRNNEKSSNLLFDYKRRSKENVRSPYANERHSYDAKQRYITRRHYGRKRRPSGANRPPPDDIIRPSYTNRSRSRYLTPRYEYTFRRSNYNSNLTLPANSKSTKFSDSSENTDAIRHPYNFKSKIQQYSQIFRTVQNGRRQMPPADRIRLKEELNNSDEEDRIKNNKYLISFNYN